MQCHVKSELCISEEVPYNNFSFFIVANCKICFYEIMRTTNRLIESSEYVHFRSSVPLRNICVDNSKGEVIVFLYIFSNKV